MDQSMICLPSDVKTALEKTNFIKRYEMLSNTFNGERTPLNERLRYIDGEIVLDSLAQLGYKAHFESKEKYFWIEEVQIGTYTFSGNMILDGGLVDIVWIVKENGNLILGLPIGEYSRLMIAPNYKIKKPIFGTYEDLDEIVESVCKLFEDFKKAMTASGGNQRRLSQPLYTFSGQRAVGGIKRKGDLYGDF